MSEGTRYYKTSCDNKPVLRISFIAWKKIQYLTTYMKKHQGDIEFTTLGIMDGVNSDLVLDVWVPKQVNTSGSTNANSDDITEWVAQKVEEGIDPRQLTFWQHSHGSLDVFWSSTDDSNIERFASDSLMWSIVTNSKGEMKARCDMFKPFRYFWMDVKVEIEWPEISGLEEWAKSAEKKMENGTVVTKASASSNKTPVVPYKSNRSGGHTYVPSVNHGEQYRQPPSTTRRNGYDDFSETARHYREISYAEWWESMEEAEGLEENLPAVTSVYYSCPVLSEVSEHTLIKEEVCVRLDDLLYEDKVTIGQALAIILRNIGLDKERLAVLAEILEDNMDYLQTFDDDDFKDVFKNIQPAIAEAFSGMFDLDGERKKAEKKAEKKKNKQNKKEKEKAKSK